MFCELGPCVSGHCVSVRLNQRIKFETKHNAQTAFYQSKALARAPIKPHYHPWQCEHRNRGNKNHSGFNYVWINYVRQEWNKTPSNGIRHWVEKVNEITNNKLLSNRPVNKQFCKIETKRISDREIFFLFFSSFFFIPLCWLFLATALHFFLLVLCLFCNAN